MGQLGCQIRPHSGLYARLVKLECFRFHGGPYEKQPLFSSRCRRFFRPVCHRLREFTGLGRAIGVAGRLG